MYIYISIYIYCIEFVFSCEKKNMYSVTMKSEMDHFCVHKLHNCSYQKLLEHQWSQALYNGPSAATIFIPTVTEATQIRLWIQNIFAENAPVKGFLL